MYRVFKFNSDGDCPRPVLVEAPYLPPSVIAPEEQWSVVNVAALTKDQPSPDKLKARAMGMLIRAFSFTAGGGNSHFPGNTMRAASVYDLDSLPAQFIPVDTNQKVEQFLPLVGVTPPLRLNYRAACKAGWAPAPTNEYQQAIWDKVHAMPKNPMKIEFDPKKGR